MSTPKPTPAALAKIPRTPAGDEQLRQILETAVTLGDLVIKWLREEREHRPNLDEIITRAIWRHTTN